MGIEGQTIYLDEAGFTGNKLLDSSQPVFVYASIAIEEGMASALCSEVRSQFKIGQGELKGSSLVKHHRGRAAIDWLLNKLSEHSRVMIINKEYAATCRLFEYVFEPILSQRNSLFYSIDFHRYVATMLYMFFRAGDSHAKQMMDGFEDLMMTLDMQHLDSVLQPVGDGTPPQSPLNEMLALVHYHRERIVNEIELLQNTSGASSWPLELSVTSLHYLLASWGEDFGALRVFCDSSKPIQSYLPFFSNFIGRTDKFYVHFGEHPTPSLVYNLTEPINLVDSKVYPGVQLADVLSSSIAYALRNPDEQTSHLWLEAINEAIVNTLRPDPVFVNLDRQESFVNTMVLLELLTRSASKEDVFEGMEEFIWSARNSYYLSR